MSKGDGKINCNAMQKKFAPLKANNEAGAMQFPDNGMWDKSHIPSNARPTKAPTPKLVFKQAKDLSTDQVYEICKAHGDVASVRECTKSGFKFVELNSEAEMEAMHKKLKSTHHYLKICIDNRFKRDNKETENRTPRRSGKNLPRSKVQEREHSGNPDTDSDEETKNITKKKEQYKEADQMSGKYSEEFIRDPKFGKCARCDRECHTICNRCSTFYCGIECQRNAWPEHRSVCGITKKILAERSVVRTVSKENDHAEYLKPEHRNASSATYNSEEAFAAFRALNNYKTNGPAENTKSDGRNTSIDGKSEDHSDSGTANNCTANGDAEFLKTKDSNSSLAANNGSGDGKSEDRSTLGAANNYKVNSPATYAINENLNSSLAPKYYTGNGSESGKIVDRSTSWAANNYKTNESEIGVKDDMLEVLSICSDFLKERPQTAAVHMHEAMPRSGSIVKLIFIHKVNVVFIRSKSYEVEADYIRLLNNLHELVEKNDLRHLEKPPKCGQIVIVRFEERYSRAVITNCDDLQEITLVYYDSGGVDHVNIRYIYECPQNFDFVPPFCTPVILKNVPDCLMTKKIHSFMNSYVDNNNLIVKYSNDEFVSKKGAYLVELIVERTNQNFNKLILNICEHKESDNDCKNDGFGDATFVDKAHYTAHT